MLRLILLIIICSFSVTAYSIQNGSSVTGAYIDRVVKLSNNCSGFLVEDNIVLTASHCLRFGWDNLYINQYHAPFDHENNPLSKFNTIDKNLYEVRKVIDVKIYSVEYSQEIALLKLEKSQNMKKLSLFSYSQSSSDYEVDMLTFAGFGPDYSKSIEGRYGLKSGVLPIYGLVKRSSYEKEVLFLGTSEERKGVQMACYGDRGVADLY